MLNKIILQATLTKDIELKYTQSGTVIASVNLANNQSWKDKNTGEKREEVLFIEGVIFGKSAEIANQYLKKGSKVLIEGQLQFQQWEDQNGNKRSKHIVKIENYNFLDSKPKTQQYPQQTQQQQQQGGLPNSIQQDEVPF
jgi:single-strand DNA-binding protein